MEPLEAVPIPWAQGVGFKSPRPDQILIDFKRSAHVSFDVSPSRQKIAPLFAIRNLSILKTRLKGRMSDVRCWMLVKAGIVHTLLLLTNIQHPTSNIRYQ